MNHRDDCPYQYGEVCERGCGDGQKPAWTTEPPTEPGLHWAMPVKHGGRPAPEPIPVMLAETIRGGLVVMEQGDDFWAPIKNYTHWAPMRRPEKP